MLSQQQGVTGHRIPAPAPSLILLQAFLRWGLANGPSQLTHVQKTPMCNIRLFTDLNLSVTSTQWSLYSPRAPPLPKAWGYLETALLFQAKLLPRPQAALKDGSVPGPEAWDTQSDYRASSWAESRHAVDIG